MADAAIYEKLTLGDADLVGFEVPNTIQLGMDQHVVVSEFVGNYQRFVQILGSQPRPISWRGIFLYQTAIDRANYFAGLCRNGVPINLVWGDFKFLVVVDGFHYEANHLNAVTYEITLTIVQDHTPVVGTFPQSADQINAGITNLIGSILSIIATIQNVVVTVTSIQKGNLAGVLGGVSNLVGGIAAVAPGLTGLSASTLQSYSAQAGIMAGQVLAFISVVDGNNPSNPIAELFHLGSQLTLLSSLVGQVASPIQPQSISILTGNAFQLASQYYGDVSAWSGIADANNLSDAQIIGPTTVNLPVVNGVAPSTTQAAPGTVFEIPVVPIPSGESR